MGAISSIGRGHQMKIWLGVLCLCAFACAVASAGGRKCTIGCNDDGEMCGCPSACWLCLVKAARDDGNLQIGQSTLKADVASFEASQRSPSRHVAVTQSLEVFTHTMTTHYNDALTGKSRRCSSCKFSPKSNCSLAQTSQALHCGIRRLRMLLDGTVEGMSPLPVGTYLANPKKYPMLTAECRLFEWKCKAIEIAVESARAAAVAGNLPFDAKKFRRAQRQVAFGSLGSIVHAVAQKSEKARKKNKKGKKNKKDKKNKR